LSDLNEQTHIISDWMPVEDPAFIGDPSSRTRSGAGMTGTRWVLFVIPAKAGIQSTPLSKSSEPLNLGVY
jgi:hypothetical protein